MTDTDYGIRISQKGSDVFSADDNDVVFTSKFALFKGSISGVGIASTTTTTMQTISIEHGFGYIPSVLVNIAPFPYTYFYRSPINVSGLDHDYWFHHYATTTHLYIRFRRTVAASTSWYYSYFIFIDKGKI